MNCRLLIHHHIKGYQDRDGIWVQATVGSWVNELANHFTHIGLLIEVTQKRESIQDCLIDRKNVSLISLGSFGTTHRLRRNRFIGQVCRSVSPDFDVLLIRGVTPKQMLVFNNTDVAKKVFLMVGSLRDARPRFKFSRVGFISWVYFKRRMVQLRKIAKCAVMLANSPGVVHELRDRFSIDATFVPTNTIFKRDMVAFALRSMSASPTLLFCGRVVDEKGIEELLLALAALKQRGLTCRLIVVGKADPPYQKRLLKIANDSGIAHLVEWVGFVEFGERLLTYYRTSDIYVLPSWHEGFPRALWEAAASCTPIIVSRVGGVPGIMSDSEVSFVPAKDPAALAQAIADVIADPAKTAARVESAYRLTSQFTLEECAIRLRQAIGQ